MTISRRIALTDVQPFLGRRAAVGNTQFPIPDNAAADTTSNSLNSRKLCFAPNNSAITDIVLAFPGFGLNNPEQDLPANYTVQCASVEYPLGTTPRQVFFNGSASVAVTAGRSLPKSDPLPIHIPAGAQFAVKCFATWSVGTFWLGTFCAVQLNGEWTARGTSLSNHALDNTVLSTTSNIWGFCPVVYATMAQPIASIGLIGDSIGSSTGDWVDTNVGYNAWGRALRGNLPLTVLARGGDTFANFASRAEGRGLILRDAITHCIVEFGGNDLFNGASLASLQASLQATAGIFLDRGVRCWAITLTPRTTSSNGWISAAGQTLLSAPIEAIRLQYNAWLRANYSGLGLQGVFDLAHAVDPTDSGKWGFDAGLANAGFGAAASATLSGGAVSSVAFWSYNGNGSQGSGFAANASVPCIVYNYPGTPGSGAAVHGLTNGSGNITSYVVDAPGSGYTYPPMVTAVGPFTSDGVHPLTRSWCEIIKATAMAPELFV